MSRFLDRLREFRLKYGPLVKLMERSESFSRLVECRPLLRPVLEKLKPQPLSPDEFTKEFLRALIEAGEGTRICVYSPYLSRYALDTYLGLMRDAVKRGASITVHTLRPDNYSIRKKDEHRKLIERLRDAKVEVIERGNMHEKAVIVLGEKEKAAYFGSLNPLSKYGGTADYMLKFTHPDIVDALHLFLETIAHESEQLHKEQE